MIVYASEIEDGLEDKLKTNNTTAAILPLVSDDRVPQKTKDRIILSSAFANAISDDLHRIYTILVTSNWNKNDDVFGVKEIWAARHTPEDKPFNIEHNPRNVIGHITDCIAVDDSYTAIADNISENDLPDKFHILTTAVLYKHVKSRDEKLTEETKELLASIARGEWYVSMEALFSDFDYALQSKADDHYRVLERSESTAFLTKHLRVHGGLGEYQGYKVGRYLKNITFSGKGLVKHPGNPESFIFNDVTQFKGVFASFDEIQKPKSDSDVVKIIEVVNYTKYGVY